MGRFKLLTIIVVILALLLGVAMVLDSRRVIRNAYDDARDIDREIERFEHAALVAAEALGAATAAPAARMLNPTERQASFDDWYARSAAGLKIDPSDPVKRPLGDQMSGAMNRRRLALPKFNERWSEYEKLQKGIRGTLAGLLGDPVAN